MPWFPSRCFFGAQANWAAGCCAPSQISTPSHAWRRLALAPFVEEREKKRGSVYDGAATRTGSEAPEKPSIVFLPLPLLRSIARPPECRRHHHAARLFDCSADKTAQHAGSDARDSGQSGRTLTEREGRPAGLTRDVPDDRVLQHACRSLPRCCSCNPCVWAGQTGHHQKSQLFSAFPSCDLH